MKLISHRGNLNGAKPILENSPNYISEALSKGFNVEIDVWYINNKWYLGHDEPIYLIDSHYLLNTNLWCHAKNLNALNYMKILSVPNFFWHESDKYTLTSSGFIWTYPNQDVTENSIVVLIDDSTVVNPNIYGVCSDFVQRFI